MGTVIEQVSLTDGGWRTHHSALRLAVNAAKHCLHEAGRNANDVDLLINAGIYRDRNLAEPALAAMIQEDIGANPEDPHEQAHGTFSFDVSNGSCGVLTALQIVDGFLKSRAIDLALVVASDADPGHGMSENFRSRRPVQPCYVIGPTMTAASNTFIGSTSQMKAKASAPQSDSSMATMSCASL